MIKIGLTGYLGSGKTTVVDCFMEAGVTFYSLSLSDAVRAEASKRGIEPTRNNLQDLGNNLRVDFGHGGLAELVLKMLPENVSSGVVIIDGIRNPAEVEVLKKSGYFYLIAVIADFQVRYDRVVKRALSSDKSILSIEEFRNADNRDMGIGEPSGGQQVEKCVQIADTIITNNNTSATLKDSVFYNAVLAVYKDIIRINRQT
ncbi:MAG: AAA family ATPase [Nanoarchaeota archaeon]